MEPWIYEDQVRPTFDAVSCGTIDAQGRGRPGTLENLDRVREIADRSPYPINRLLRAYADVAEHDRATFAERQRTSAAADPVDPRRLELVLRHDRDRRHAATTLYASLSLAIEHCPDELLGLLGRLVEEREEAVGRLLAPFLARLFGATWDHLTQRIDALETALAAQLEAAR